MKRERNPDGRGASDTEEPTANARKVVPVVDIKDDSRLHPCFDEFFSKSNGKFVSPTNIQAHCWPVIHHDQSDLLAIAPTGSGKTLAYLLPGLAHILENRVTNKALAIGAPRVLVLVPTRELAIQVQKVTQKFTKLFNVKSTVVYGGRDRDLQVEHVQVSQLGFIVATPGRALDLLGTGDMKLDLTSMLILDECDRMLDLGFEPQIREIVSKLKDDGHGKLKTQNVMLSATFPKKLRSIIDSLKLLGENYVAIRVEQGGEVSVLADMKEAILNEDEERDKFISAISPTITQIVQVCAEHKKPRKLIRFIEKVYAEDKEKQRRNKSSILVFCTKIKTVQFVDEFLRVRHKMNCSVMHGNLKQTEREKALREFKAGKTKILVATDVAGRGIDIKGLPYVVNYDFPSTLKVYAHRIGRTGRQVQEGTAFSFFTRKLAPIAPDLIELLRSCNQKVDSYLLQLVNDGSSNANEANVPKRKRRRKKKEQP